jgi:hypothetical protein
MLETGAQSAGNGDELVFGIRCRAVLLACEMIRRDEHPDAGPDFDDDGGIDAFEVPDRESDNPSVVFVRY